MIIRPLALPEQRRSVQRKNKATWNSIRPRENAEFFTIGYRGRSIEEVVGALRNAGVRTLIDVRRFPVSQFKPEFSKRNLASRLLDAGIDYVHRGDLGVPRDIRARAIQFGTRQAIWEWYDEHVALPCFGSNLDIFFNGAEHPVVLMCTEYDPTSCHRHRICLFLERHGLRSHDL